MGNSKSKETSTYEKIGDLKAQVLGETPSDKLVDQIESLCPDLSYPHRIIGFIICCGVGWFLTFYSLFSLLGVALGNITGFAVVFSLSQLLNIAGVCFLSGPKSQVRGLKKPGRLFATTMLLTALLMCLVSALFIKNFFVCLFFVILSVTAYVWYTCTLFPFGQRMCKGCLKNLCFSSSNDN